MQVIHTELQTSEEARGIICSLRCELTAWRKPEEETPSIILETCCLLFSTTWLLGPLTPKKPHGGITAVLKQV